ncbi:TetR family transcriptional regulator [Nocardioides panacisoli]|uniref:TetR/AcrR family transcriptional regulator n=1 Tax=Nocardioides panacisoli TaxID=627624 RepID=UPI001C637646|nr:TetR family transcriptional regulator [Nocardioides panacisoli]QYJ03759.1 TetR family transcriptional regulator [Nocardioides panacisoli]
MTSVRPGRRGRRPGSPDTRAAILAAARERFAEVGYAGTTIRAVAAAAGVDGALVHHYYGSKDDLFLAALELPVDPREVLAEAVVSGDRDDAGERLVRTFLAVWDDPDNQPALIALVRRVLEPGGEPLLRDGFLPVVLVPIGERLGIDRPELRMPLLASQVLGLITLRYLVVVEPLASMDADALVAAYAPVVQRYLTGPLPG